MTEITKGFILAAGRGMRMRPLTDTCPKPLLEVGGKPILGYTIDSLVEAGVTDIIVNVSYLGDMIIDYLRTRTDVRIEISHEDEALETGGGVKKELAFFGNEPFFVMNGDVIVEDIKTPALQNLKNVWDEDRMDLCLLIHPLDEQHTRGDYGVDAAGRLTHISRLPEHAIGDGKFAGPRIVHPRLFENSPDGAFGFLDLFDKAEKAGRLFGALHDGGWHHIGTPDALEVANIYFNNVDLKSAAS